MAPDNGSQSPPLRPHYTDTIIVLVGQSEDKFTVHEEVITRNSDFFRAACGGEFKEGKEKIVRLPDVTQDTFRSYVHWAYSNTVVIENVGQLPEQDYLVFEAFAKLWIAGDVLGNMRLRNAVINCMIKNGKANSSAPDLECVKLAYNQTPEGSALRRLVLDWWLTGRDAGYCSYFREHGEEFPAEFLVDFVQNTIDHKVEELPRVGFQTRCRYHEHDDQVPKLPSCGTPS